MSLLRCVSLSLLISGAASVRARSRRSTAPSSKFIGGVPVLNYQKAYGGKASLSELERDEQEWVVMARPGTTDEQLAAMCEGIQNGCNLVGSPSSGGIPFVEFRGSEQDLSNIISKSGRVRYVEPDSKISVIPDIEVGAQAATWGLTRIGVDSRSQTGAGVTIFVFDTGIRTTHQEFNDRAASALDISSGYAVACAGALDCAGDVYGHGTHVAGSAAGEFVGVAPAANLRAVKVLDDYGWGSLSWSYIACDLLSTRGMRPAVASMSLGSGGVAQAFADAIDTAVAGGIVVVVAGGNENLDACQYSPAFVPSAITVGSTDSLDQRSPFSNYGPCTNIWAPGSSVYSASVAADDAYVTYSGTSMACPHVAGGVALLLEGSPKLNPAQVLTVMQTNAERDAISDLTLGDVNLLLNVGPPTPAPPTPVPPPPGTWELFGSGCQMEANCIFSNNYPLMYGVNQSCDVALYGEIPFRTDAFDTESVRDFLRVGDVYYSGTSGPPTGSYTGSIHWATSARTARPGWKMCRTDQPDAPPTPAPPPPSWTISGTGCYEVANCLFSNNYPSIYGNDEACTVTLDGNVSLTVQSFNTEPYLDILTVGGEQYSGYPGYGTLPPPSGVYSGVIQWSTDNSRGQQGWMLCSP